MVVGSGVAILSHSCLTDCTDLQLHNHPQSPQRRTKPRATKGLRSCDAADDGVAWEDGTALPFEVGVEILAPASTSAPYHCLAMIL